MLVFTVFATKWEATRVSRWMLQRFHVLLDLFQGFEQDHIPNDRILTLFGAYTKTKYPHKNGGFGPRATCWANNWTATAGCWLLDRGSLVWKLFWPTPLTRDDPNKRLESDIKRVGC